MVQTKQAISQDIKNRLLFGRDIAYADTHEGPFAEDPTQCDIAPQSPDNDWHLKGLHETFLQGLHQDVSTALHFPINTE